MQRTSANRRLREMGFVAILDTSVGCLELAGDGPNVYVDSSTVVNRLA